MNNIKQKKISTAEQFKTMVQFMECHVDLVAGNFTTVGGSKHLAANLWSELALSLNAIGPPIRNADGWKKVWADFKNKTRKKIYKSRQNQNKTGKSETELYLNPDDERIALLTEMKSMLGEKTSFDKMKEKLFDLSNIYEEVETDNIILENDGTILSNGEWSGEFPSVFIEPPSKKMKNDDVIDKQFIETMNSFQSYLTKTKSDDHHKPNRLLYDEEGFLYGVASMMRDLKPKTRIKSKAKIMTFLAKMQLADLSDEDSDSIELS